MRDGEPEMTPEDLRICRILSGSSQEALAHRLGVPLRTYVDWESGRAPIRHSRMLALALAALIEGLSPWRRPPEAEAPPRRRGRPRKPIIG